jgi:butyryl-CoA dehydrogenase
LQGVAAEKALTGSPSDQETAFYQGKLQTMQFFHHYELPKIEGLSRRLLETDGLTAKVTLDTFAD